jgi:hypothetical protein
MSSITQKVSAISVQKTYSMDIHLNGFVGNLFIFLIVTNQISKE